MGKIVQIVPLWKIALWLFLPLLAVGCRPTAMPKPYGYFRIAVPDTAYHRFADARYPYSFRVSEAAQIVPIQKQGENYWINIHYPTLNADIHCSYKPVHRNLGVLLRDANEFIYHHTMMASAIPEQEFANPDQHVWGVYTELHGNTATPIQFFLTDSVHHFFRASVYCNAVPNRDSLEPVYRFLTTDVRTLIESFQWQK